MKFRTWLAVVCVAAVASGLNGSKTSSAQDLFSEPTAPGKIGPREIQAIPGPPAQVFKSKVGPESMYQIEEAAKALHDAKDDEAKAKAESKLTELLNKSFQEDMKRREEELKKVEARIRNLRALLEKRREKQHEIIELQIKVLLNEADGLGFFNNALTPGQPGWSVFQAGPGIRGESGGVTIVTPPSGSSDGFSTAPGPYASPVALPPAAGVPGTAPRPGKAPTLPKRVPVAIPAEPAEPQSEPDAAPEAEPTAENSETPT